LQLRQIEQLVDEHSSRSPSPTTASLSSVRSSSLSDGVPSACPAATIAVSGVRKSCDTARSSAVLMSSLRRSASVCTASACIASRRRAIATSASSAGTTCERKRAETSAGRPRGTSSVAICVPSLSRSASAWRRSSASAWPRTIDADGSSRPSDTRLAVAASASFVPDPARSSRANAAARSASLRRLSASCARLRAMSAIVLTTIATIMNAASATQLRLSAIVKRPVGGMWKKLKAAALSREVAMPRASPQ